MVFTFDLFNQYTTNVRDRALIWTVWSIRLQISIFQRNLGNFWSIFGHYHIIVDFGNFEKKVQNIRWVENGGLLNEIWTPN